MTNHTTTLGTFSLSLAVADLEASYAFYQKLGFTVFAGDAKHGMVILRNGDATIGLFQGMFERNMLTFNPGWDASCNTPEGFTDVRELQARLRASGIEPVKPCEESGKGPASFIVVDPDGNPVLIDQHV
jgi:lactoylglutathione lyase